MEEKLLRSTPRRPKQHVTEDESFPILSRAISRQGWIFRRLTSDYGIDGEIEVVKRGHVTGALLRVQVKGSRGTARAIRAKASSVKYWRISPVPVVLIHVNVTSEHIRVLHFEEGHTRVDETKSECRISMAKSDDIEEAWGALEAIAFDHQTAALELRNYTLYNPAAQFISWARLMLQHRSRIDDMIHWARTEASHEALISDFGYYVYLKQQIEKDPGYLQWIRETAFAIDPSLRKAVEKRERETRAAIDSRRSSRSGSRESGRPAEGGKTAAKRR